MSNIDKHAVQAVADLKAGYTLGHADVAILNELARIALASLEAEAVAFRSKLHPPYAGSERWDYTDHRQPDAFELENCFIERLYTAPPAPVEDTEIQRKAAIHDALCEKYSVESLADFVEWQRNHIAELEAAPPAPMGEGETAVMPDYPGYVMTQRECFGAGKKAGMAELVTTAYKLPDGWVSVPVEPTAEMISSGIAAHYERSQIQIHDKPAPGPMECAYVAMLAAAPRQEVKS